MQEKKLTVQNWIKIEKIFDNGIIKFKNNKYIKLIQVMPINFNLKSDFEKKSILNSYKVFLKTCNFDIQILIQSNKENLSKHISQIQENNFNQKDELALWLKFIDNPVSEEVQKSMKEKENKYLKQAQEELGYLNGDPAFRRLIEARAGFLRDQHAFEVAGLEEGEKIRRKKEVN